MNDLTFHHAKVRAVHIALCRPPCYSSLPQPTCHRQASAATMTLNFKFLISKSKRKTLNAVMGPHWNSMQILLRSFGFFTVIPHIKKKCPPELHVACLHNNSQSHTFLKLLARLPVEVARKISAIKDVQLLERLGGWLAPAEGGRPTAVPQGGPRCRHTKILSGAFLEISAFLRVRLHNQYLGQSTKKKALIFLKLVGPHLLTHTRFFPFRDWERKGSFARL